MPRHHLLTHGEEIFLAITIEAGRDECARPDQIAAARAARETFAACNTGLVHSIAIKWSAYDPAATCEDIVSEGHIGLLTAIDKFDWRKGARFSSYASWWIRQHIIRFIENSGRIRIPSHVHAGKSKPETQAAAALVACVASLDDPLPGRKGEGSQSDLGDIVPSDADTEAKAMEITRQERMRQIVAEILATLPEKHRNAMLSYANGGTLADAAAASGLSCERVRQIVTLRAHKYARYRQEVMELLS